MPQTEQCPLGIENKTNIANLDRDFVEFKIDVKKYMEDMNECVKELTNHYSKRPTWFVSLVITALVGLCIFLTQHIITQKGKNVAPKQTQPVKAPP
jgi:uncharacterized membrane protein YcfT